MEVFLGLWGSSARGSPGIYWTLPRIPGCRCARRMQIFDRGFPRFFREISQTFAKGSPGSYRTLAVWVGLSQMALWAPGRRMWVFFRGSAGHLWRIYQALWPGCGESTRPQNRTPSIASLGCRGWRQSFMEILRGFSWISTRVLLEVYREFVRVLPDLKKKDLVLMHRQLIKWLPVLAYQAKGKK